MFLCSEFRLVMSVRFPHEKDVRLVFYLQLFVGGFMSYLLYLCLLAESGGQHIFLRLVHPILQVSLECPYFIARSVLSNTNLYICTWSCMLF